MRNLKRKQTEVSPSSLFNLVWRPTPFTRDGAISLLLTLHRGFNESLLNKYFLSKDQRYYMNDDFLDEVNADPFNLTLNDMNFDAAIQINGQDGFILQDPANTMQLLAKRLNCSLEKLAFFMPEKHLNPNGVERLTSYTMTELGLSERDVMYYHEPHSDNHDKLRAALLEVINRKVKFMFCYDGAHTNLISVCHIDQIQYFFILDSQSYAPKGTQLSNKNGILTITSIINRNLMMKQIDALTSLNRFIVIGEETRQRDPVSCPMFAREDLRTLYHFEDLHREMLNNSSPTKENIFLHVFPSFPAQMLMLHQVKAKELSEDLRSQENVMDRNGAVGPLGVLAQRYYNAHGYNMYAQTLMNEFVYCDNNAVPRLAYTPPIILSFAIEATPVISMSNFLIWQQRVTENCSTKLLTCSQ